MKSWWYKLSLHNKLQIPLQLMLLLVLVAAQIWGMKEFKNDMYQDVEESAFSNATQAFLGLNSMMLTGNISQPELRAIYFKKMANQGDVKDFYLVRGHSLQEQFGAGLAEEQPRDELDRKAILTNEVQIQHITTDKPAFRMVVPFAATHDFHGTDCLQCHQARDGEVIGAVSITISLQEKYDELYKMRIVFSLGQILLQILLFFFIAFLIRKAIATVINLEKTILSINVDGDFSRRVGIESDDEVGHIARVFNTFLQRMSELKQDLSDKVTALEMYRDGSEQEQRVAARYMNKLIAVDKLKDPAVQFYLKPAENFSGDLIAMARTPDNRLHLLLADSTGHGLSAALAAMPMIHPFYSMTSKGFTTSTIAKEINKKVWESLPVSHFVAAIIVSIDAVSHMVEVWSGGCPPPFLLNSEGECEYQFKPRHLAMGILPPEQFDASVEYYSYEGGGKSLVMFSDGVIELENGDREQFGLARLLQVVHVSDMRVRWERTIQAIEQYCGAKSSGNDDIALMMVQCESGESFTKRKVNSELPGQEQIEGNAVWQFVLTLTMQQIKKLDVVPLLLDIVQQIEKDKERGSEIFMVLSEMFNNALDHGVLKLDSTLKHHEDGMEKYFEERSIRLANTETGYVQLNLKKIVNTDGSAFLRIRVTDSGDGFDFRQVSDKVATNTQRYGRGIALLYHVCHKVEFSHGGSEILVEFDLPDVVDKSVLPRVSWNAGEGI